MNRPIFLMKQLNHAVLYGLSGGLLRDYLSLPSLTFLSNSLYVHYPILWAFLDILPTVFTFIFYLELIPERLRVVVVYYPERFARLQGIPYLEYLLMPLERRHRPQVQG